MINNDNYEVFFLMYVDNELSTTEKEMVETFVQQHPHLQEELSTLKQTVLLPEKDIVFTNKNLLYKHTKNYITTENYEAHFLLYIDNELPKTEKLQVETFVLQHPQLQKHFTILQNAKLPIEVIACPNKEGLYKKERKSGVIYMRWFGMATAAVVLGLIATIYFVVPSSKTIGHQTLANTSPTIPNKLVKETAQNKLLVTPESPKNIEPNKEALTILVTRKNSTHSKVNIITALVTKPEAAITNKPYKNDAIAFLQTPSKKTENNIDNAVTNSTTNRNNNSTSNNDIMGVTSSPIKVTNALNTSNLSAQQAVIYKVLDTNTDDKSLLVGSIEINKDKLRGFLRKASKLFGNKQKNNTETDAQLSTEK